MASSFTVCACLLVAFKAVAGLSNDIGIFRVSVGGSDGDHGEKSHIQIANVETGKIAWQTSITDSDLPFLRLGNATVSGPPIVDGNYQLHETTTYLSNDLTVDKIMRINSHMLAIGGRLLSNDEEGSPSNTQSVATYTLKFHADDHDGSVGLHQQRLLFSIDIIPDSSLTVDGGAQYPLEPRLFLDYWCDASNEEGFYGFGESFTYFNLNGLRVPIVVSEQGVGRGEQPITDYMNEFVAEGSGGYWFTTYAPKAAYVTSLNRSMVVDSSAAMFFDLTDADTTGTVQLEVWSLSVTGYILPQQDALLDAVSALTTVTGRQAALPKWTQKGAVVGLEGGTEEVTRIVDEMRTAGVPIAGVWLQDWVGLQHNWDGDRLIWNWEVNFDYYPGWNDMVSQWHQQGIRVLTYINPFFADPSAYVDDSEIRHNFFQEGIDNGYFVQQYSTSTEGVTTLVPYLQYSLSIQFATVDLTNPAARKWMKNIIIEQSIIEAQSSGWMCDFGEYLPFDAVLFSGESAAEYHNRYPQEWAKLTAEAVAESKNRINALNADISRRNASATVTHDNHKQDSLRLVEVEVEPVEDDYETEIMYFMRSAWIESSANVPVFWLGDQLVSWDSNDGLRSSIVGALSSGLTGHALTHSDIGGYTVEENLGPRLNCIRSPELLMRWSEMEAFGFGLFRTHIGSSRTGENAQVYDSPESLAHFAEFASVFAHLYEYRAHLMVEAHTLGYPMVRPLAAYFGYDKSVWSITEQYMFGSDFLVAPCLYESAQTVDVYFPQYSGPWVHIWSGREIQPADGQALTMTVPAQIGFPPVFFKKGSRSGESLRLFLHQKGYSDGYSWDTY